MVAALTVLICTHNRADLLERVLASLDDGMSGAVVPALAVREAADLKRRALFGGGEAFVRDVGPGRIVLVTDGALFSDTALGGVYVTPTRAQQEIYKGEEELLRILLGPHE